MAADSPSSPTPSRDALQRAVLRIFTSRTAADLAAAKLEANNLPCWIEHDDCGGVYPGLAAANGVRLLVLATDLPAASELLKDSLTESEQAGLRETPAELQPVPPAGPWRLSSKAAFILGLLLGALACYGLTSYLHHPITDLSLDHNHDGRVDEQWTYNRRGLAVSYRKDRNFDGAWDYWVHYSAAGQADLVEKDNNFDGKVDERWFYENGSLSRVERDTDFNGQSDEYAHYQRGLVATVEIAPNGSANVTQRHLYTNGVLYQIQRQPDAHGNFTELVDYNPFCEPVGTNTHFPLLPATNR